MKKKTTKIIEKEIVKEETRNLMGFTEKLFCFSITCDCVYELCVCVLRKEGLKSRNRVVVKDLVM